MDFWLRLKHTLFHRHKDDHMLERRPGELYLRCGRCGLRSRSLALDPPKFKLTQSGSPDRFGRVEPHLSPMAEAPLRLVGYSDDSPETFEKARVH